MINVTITEGDYAQITRELALENAKLRTEKSAFARVIGEMETQIATMEAERAPSEGPLAESGQQEHSDPQERGEATETGDSNRP